MYSKRKGKHERVHVEHVHCAAIHHMERQTAGEGTSYVANLGQENTMYYDNVSKKWIDTSEDTDADAANADAPPIANADAPPIGGYPVANIQSTCRRYRS